MDSPLRAGDVVRMVAAQFCFIAAVGFALVALMLMSTRVDHAILTTAAIMTAGSAATAGIGVALLSGRTRYGFIAGSVYAVALFFVLAFAHLVASLLEIPLG